jgi:hypothetical protein
MPEKHIRLYFWHWFSRGGAIQYLVHQIDKAGFNGENNEHRIATNYIT